VRNIKPQTHTDKDQRKKQEKAITKARKEENTKLIFSPFSCLPDFRVFVIYFSPSLSVCVCG
jgi:hypothetical protein